MATYNGDTNFNASPASAGVSHQVNKADTTATITADAPDPSVVGQNYAVTASVAVSSPGAGTPTGTITVSDGTNTCTITLPAASCNLPSTSAGAKTLTATYNGDANFNASPASSGVAHTVNKADTTATITADTPDPSVVGQNYAVTASVAANSPGGGTPTGTITVSDGTNTCTITLPAASCNLPSTSAGAKTLTATYNGDTNFNASPASAGVMHTVNKANTQLVSLTDAPDPSVVGQPYTVGFTLNVVAPGAGTPTGTVTVVDGTGGTCTATLPTTSCSLTSTTAGAKTLTFTYNGDANFNTSNSTAGHQVNKANTTTTITNAAALATATLAGQAYAVNWSVTVNSPGAVGAALSGNVTVNDGLSACTAAVSAGTCNLTSTTAGAKTITATYAGDVNYNGSASTGVSHQVNCPTIDLTPKPPLLNNAAAFGLPAATVGSNYTLTITATPAGGNYTYAVIAAPNVLPTNLTLNPTTGVISGIPNVTGSFVFRVQATGFGTCVGSRLYSLRVNAAFAPTQAAKAVRNDFDGDGKSDLAQWHADLGEWQVAFSSDGALHHLALLEPGEANEKNVYYPAAADFDGDQRTDAAIWRARDGRWLIKRSSDGTLMKEHFGLAGDTPLPADFDGDGKADAAVWRNGGDGLHILRSSDQTEQAIYLGQAGDVPVLGDFDGDGKIDLAVFSANEGRWQIRSAAYGSLSDAFFGRAGDQPLAADYDGDGKDDLVVWRQAEGVGYARRSSDQEIQRLSWGRLKQGEWAVSGDYDGDGRADMAIWRITKAVWEILFNPAASQ
jgi:hypothetical protein